MTNTVEPGSAAGLR